MSTTTDRALTESLLAFGRQATLQTTPIDATVAPAYAGPGYTVANVSRVGVVARLGREGGVRRSVLTAPTFDAAATYTLVIDGGTPIVVATPADATALYAALAAGIGAAPGYTATSSASGCVIAGPPASVSWTATGGTTSLTLATEYAGARLRLYSRVAATQVARVTDADDLETSQAWGLHSACGDACDYAIDSDGLTIDALPVSTVDSVRPWLTGLVGVTGDAADTITYRAPVVLVLPCILGAS